jgi:hypothetical protein
MDNWINETLFFESRKQLSECSGLMRADRSKRRRKRMTACMQKG